MAHTMQVRHNARNSIAMIADALLVVLFTD